MLVLHFLGLRAVRRRRLQIPSGACSLRVWAGVVLAGRGVGHLS
jgi:hypothetical protein